MKKYSYKYVESYFENNRCKLLSTDYKNSRQKLDYICENGHSHSIPFYHFKEGHRCPMCAAENKSEKFRFDYNKIKSSFDIEGYELLTTYYVNAHQYLNYKCLNGHINKMTYNNWSKGYRCPTCAIINNSGRGHWNWKGGISCEPYCDAWADKDYKESIKERDGYQCQNSYCFRKSGKASQLTIHHIDYDKQNCAPSNLVTLCRSCNALANIDREWHKHWYQTIMSKKYNYSYKE